MLAGPASADTVNVISLSSLPALTIGVPSDPLQGGINVSVPPGSPAVTVDALTLTTCSGTDFTLGSPDCGAGEADPGVLSIGSAMLDNNNDNDGCAAAGPDYIPFTVSGPSATGVFTLTPPAPFVVQPDDQFTSRACFILLQVTALKAPLVDVDGGDPDIQGDAFVTALLPSPDVAAVTSDFNRFFTVLQPVQPSATVALAATPTATLGGPITATATLTGVPGGPTPTGTVGFSLYPPNPPNNDCNQSTVQTSFATLVNGTVTSLPFDTTALGTYRYQVTYDGDGTYAAIPATTCGLDGTMSVVSGLPTTLTLVASPPVTPDHAIFATATLGGGLSPTGTIVFKGFRNNPTCDGKADLTSTVSSVADVGQFTSDHFTIAADKVGTYRFTAAYSGDDNNAPSATACDVAGTSVVVMAASAVKPTITLDTGATPASVATPGGTFTYHLTVTNTSPNPVTTKTLDDKVYGNLDGRGTCKVGVVLKATPGPDDSYTCSYTGDFSGAAGAAQTATVTASALDDSGNEATATHDTTVSLVAAAATANPAAAAAAAVPLAATPSGGTGTGGTSGTSGTGGSLAVTGAGLEAQLRLAFGLLAAGLVLTRRRSRPEPPSPVLTRPW